MSPEELDLFLGALRGQPVKPTAGTIAAQVARARLWVAAHTAGEQRALALEALAKAGAIAERAPERAAQLLRAAITNDSTKAPALFAGEARSEFFAELEGLAEDARRFELEADQAWRDFVELEELAVGVGRYALAVLLSLIP